MLRRSELPLLDDDPGLFETLPEWLVPGLRTSRPRGDDGGLGLRALLEGADAPPRVDAVRRRSRQRMWSTSARVAFQRAAPERATAGAPARGK
jgi:hypothetical protein